MRAASWSGAAGACSVTCGPACGLSAVSRGRAAKVRLLMDIDRLAGALQVLALLGVCLLLLARWLCGCRGRVQVS